MQVSYVYILKCSVGRYYTGITSHVSNRIESHIRGDYPDSYTAKRRPVELVFYAEFTNINIAIETEKKIKSWSRVKKEALINEKYDLLPNPAKKNFKK